MTDSDYTWYDECFRVEEGILWNSFLKDGTAVLSTLTKEMCITETRHYLKAKYINHLYLLFLNRHEERLKDLNK